MSKLNYTVCTVTLQSGEVIERKIRQYNDSYYVIYRGSDIPVKRDKIVNGRQTYKQYDRVYEACAQNNGKWKYEINDVLLIKHKGQDFIARVAGYVDQMDNTKPLYCNIRIAVCNAWGQRRVTVLGNEIIKFLPSWQEDRDAEFEASVKEVADRAYAKMTPQQKSQLRASTEHTQRRATIDMMIDHACGLD